MYYLEYCCLTSFAERAHLDSEKQTKYLEQNAYVILTLSYQVGVFLSRSSLSFFKVEKVWYLTYLQIINFGIFFSIAIFRWMPTQYQIPLMVFVGLMGGCSYVNCYYLILENDTLDKRVKELATNIASFFVDFGILAASLTAFGVSMFLITNK